MDTGTIPRKRILIREIVHHKSVTDCWAPFSRQRHKRLRTMDIYGHVWSLVQATSNEMLKVFWPDAPLVPEPCGW
uniref:Uncharacterized protein n=1 Tax=uncultured Rhodospirillales bacterium HF4000_24M03 TaxID=710788 RepID=E0XW36_9PROT|nr:hypothetical protein [uncultured Rhodospirillales bacterium HF4000_24M03]